MKELKSVMGRKGQVTVPAEIRKLLQLKQGDKVAFVLEAGHVHLARRERGIRRTAGALRSKQRHLTPEQLREAAELATAKETVDRAGGSPPNFDKYQQK